MKPTRTVTLFLLILGLSLSGKAQNIYYITSNTSTNPGPYAPGTNCSNCEIIISPGVTLTINSAMSCTKCNFSGGTVDISSGSNLTLNNTDTFSLSTVVISQALNTSSDSVLFYGDSVAFTTNENLSSTVFDLDSDRVAVNASLLVKNATFNKDSLHVNNNLTLASPTDTIENSHVDLATGVTLSTNTAHFINNNFAFTGTSKMTVGLLTSTGNNYYLAGSSSITGSNAINSTSDNIVMTGTTNSLTTTLALTTTNTNISLKGTAGTLNASEGLTSTLGSITAASGSSITSGYTATLTNTTVNVTGTTLKFSQGLTASGATISATGGSTVSIAYTPTLSNTSLSLSGGTLTLSQGLTTSGGSITASNGANVSVAYSPTLINTTTSLNDATLTLGQGVTTSGGSFSASNGSNVTSAYSPTLTNTTTSLNASTLTSAQGLTMSGGSFDLTNATASTDPGYSTTMSGTSALLSGTSTFNTGSLSLSSNSFFQIGDGTGTSTANANLSSILIEDASSILTVAQDNNYLNSQTSNLSTNSDNCGGTYPNACQTNYLYGCATVTNGQLAVACVTLALANFNLTAAVTGAKQVGLNWTDNESGSADHYTVQRNTGNLDWTDIGTVAANSATSTYTFTDLNAPVGTIRYRIVRTANGNDGYSDVVTLTIAPTATNAQIGLFPNPATGGRFYLTTGSTGELIVNVYTTTGELLYRTVLQGQTQYPIQLPSQPQSLNAIIVQTVYQNNSQSFTVLVHP